MTKKYFIKTFGCQQNVADSEKIAGWYEDRGWKKAKTIEEADEIVINTCSVRQSAEDRAFGLIRNLKQSVINNLPTGKAGQQSAKIIITGCILYHPLRWLREKMPGVDEFKRKEEYKINSQFAIRNSQIHAWMPIMEGCNNFCTYCVVPYARGREVSKPFNEIVFEVEQLAKQGYKHITLLGQNVNSYGKDIKKSKIKNQKSKLQFKIQNCEKRFKTLFALLLVVLHETPGIKKISFMTSNPWDLSDEIIEAISLPKIDRYLHLAVQSGDNKILQKMNRKYTVAQYIKLVEKIRKKIPDIKIGTDIIVGFPGETKKQFENTVKLCKKISFVKAYVSIYSPRPGTAAFKLKDNVSHQEKRRRWKILDEMINKKSSLI